MERLKVDDEVLGVISISQAGAFAESLIADEKNAALKPPSISFEQAAALTLVSVTAWNALVGKAKLRPGQSVFLTGCLGGVGRSAVQIARMHGAEVAGSCSASGREEALALGMGEAHATTAGARVTILKAFFNENYPLFHPVEATADGTNLAPWKGQPLTLGNEINKLASNIALGRDAAGVHYRSDSISGLFVGEEQALGLLCDYSRTYNERFDGFVLSTFIGDKVSVVNGELKSA